MKKILIANRGEIARRVIHTAHRMGIETVAVYSEPDAQALHVREATQAVALGGASSADSYLCIDKLLAAAHASGADAIHPGYGFLSENAQFAQAVVEAGLVWIGPSAAAIRVLGSKAGAKALAAAQGVPCLPGYAGPDQSDARFADEAARIGYPLMVKAVAGGGGRGMRLVNEPGQLLAALVSARSEALTGFGSAELLIERALLQPRHVEVQVFADTQGHYLHLGERDCSVQRRHQKIIEEAPSPAVNAALRARMGACAVSLAQGAGYVGAGTVEFLMEDGQFYLMEMNTRLQVEHPVTEALIGQDLVAWQIRVARGEPLPWTQEQVTLQGHAIEVRLCAEDAQFHPHTGRVQQLAAPAATAFELSALGGLRLDHALEVGSEVSAYYDAMLGKLIVHAATREEAIDTLLRALQATRVLGLPTNRAFLAACLDHPLFRSGDALVPFLAQHADAIRESLLKEELLVQDLSGLAAVLAQSLPAGPVTPRGAVLPCHFARPVRLRQHNEVHAWSVRDEGQGRWEVQGKLQGKVEATGLAQDTSAQTGLLASGAPPNVAAPGVATPGVNAPAAHALALRRHAEGHVTAQLDGLSRTVHVVRVGPWRWHWQTGGVDGFVEDASWEPVARASGAASAAELRAPFNGRVVSVQTEAGSTLQAGATVLVIESMKLEHSVTTPRAATVAEVLVAVGQQVTPGQVLARFASAEVPATDASRTAQALP